MDIETCKEMWVKMTKRVFETDKTIVGIPYKTTFFKASKLESAIKEITQQFTVDECESSSNGIEGDVKRSKSLHSERPTTKQSLRNFELDEKVVVTSPDGDEKSMKDSRDFDERNVKFDPLVRHQSNAEGSPVRSILSRKLGNPEALLYDPRGDRCKTYVRLDG